MIEYKNEEEKLIAQLENDPIYFIEVFLERKLSSKQRLFIENIKKYRHNVAIWSRQTGKSTVIASYILWKLLYGKGKDVHGEHLLEHIIILAPIKDQVTNLYDKIKLLIDRSPYISSFLTKMNSVKIIAKNGNKISFLSASPGAKIRGATATVIVIDETQDITDNKYSADILPFGATTNALIIEAGTPKTKNHFWKTIRSKTVHVVKQMWFECPFLSEEYVMGQKAISPDALWRQEYLCEFVEEGVLAFPPRLFEPESKDGISTGRWNLGEYKFYTRLADIDKTVIDKIAKLIKEKGAMFVMGNDLGRTKDFTCITIYRVDERPIRLYAKIKFDLGTAYPTIVPAIAFLYKVFSPYEVNLDYSNEKSFVDMLIAANVPIIIDKKQVTGAIAFTQKNKTEMIKKAVVLLENYDLQLPKEDESLLKEFMDQQFEIINNRYQYYHPSDENDDQLWSTLLALKNIHIEGVSVNKEVKDVNSWNKFSEDVHGDKQRKKRGDVTYAKDPLGRRRDEMLKNRRLGRSGSTSFTSYRPIR